MYMWIFKANEYLGSNKTLLFQTLFKSVLLLPLGRQYGSWTLQPYLTSKDVSLNSCTEILFWENFRMRMYNYQDKHVRAKSVSVLNMTTNRTAKSHNTPLHSTQCQSWNSHRERCVTHRPVVFDKTTKKSGIARKRNSSVGHLFKLHSNKIEQISMKKIHSVNMTSFCIFFLHIKQKLLSF